MTEEIPYKILKKNGDFEIRRYPEIILSVVEGFIDDSGFGLLFQYIRGENTIRRRIPMTAPVISKKSTWLLSFPLSYTKETTPIPLNPAVKINVQPQKEIAVLRFSGRTSHARISKFLKKL